MDKSKGGKGEKKKKTHNKQRALEVIRLPISKEVPHDDNGQDEQDDHEDLEVEVHGLVQDPAGEHDERGVEEGCLQRGAEAVEEGEVLCEEKN